MYMHGVRESFLPRLCIFSPWIGYQGAGGGTGWRKASHPPQWVRAYIISGVNPSWILRANVQLVQHVAIIKAKMRDQGDQTESGSLEAIVNKIPNQAPPEKYDEKL